MRLRRRRCLIAPCLGLVLCGCALCSLCLSLRGTNARHLRGRVGGKACARSAATRSASTGCSNALLEISDLNVSALKRQAYTALSSGAYLTSFADVERFA